MSVDAFPAAIQAIVQNGILERTFQKALQPALLYRALAAQRPFQANMGEKVTFTRTGLLTPTTTPLAPGNDPATDTYGIEQYEMTLNQYGKAMDTNMLSSQIALASKFLQDNYKLAFNAAQSLNHLVRDKLYGAYKGGNTSATGAGANITALVVADCTGFSTVLVNGVQTAVSAGNPLAITVNGVAANVIAASASSGAGTLTLQANATWANGDPVVASNAGVIMRPNARTTVDKLVAGDNLTLSSVLDGVANLRDNNVPDFGGYYVMHLDATSERQLYSDADFKQALVGREDSPVWGKLSIGRFAGIDWVRNTESPTVTNAGALKVHQPILMGGETIIEGPLEGFGALLQGTQVNRPGLVTMVDGIAMIHRPPLDRLQQVIGSAWSWVGDFAIPTDALTGSAAQYKRAVVFQHV